jgi:hypothetical protein
MRSRYFLSYSGVQLPLQLVEELQESALKNRNTWFCADYDDAGRVIRIEKIVYGEVEMTHVYKYDSTGRLSEATVLSGDGDEEENIKTLCFDREI